MARQIDSARLDLDRLDDSTLVRLARQRNAGAYRAIMQRHNRRLYRTARGILRNDSEAEDVVQETYCRAFTRLDEFRGDASLATWLTRIAFNEALGRLRRQRPTVELTMLDEMPTDETRIIPFPAMHNSDPERGASQREIRLLIERAIDALPEAFRIVFVMRVVEDVSIEETAALLSLKPATVKTRLHRARGLLREALDQELASTLTDAFPFAGHRCARINDAVLRRLGIEAT